MSISCALSHHPISPISHRPTFPFPIDPCRSQGCFTTHRCWVDAFPCVCFGAVAPLRHFADLHHHGRVKRWAVPPGSLRVFFLALCVCMCPFVHFYQILPSLDPPGC
eukprot:RCo026677